MKRREFVTKSSLVTAAMATSTSAFGLLDSKSGNGVINLGIIGTGDRGSGLIPLINQIEDLKVIACCDILPFRLENGLSKVTGGKAEAYKDYRKLLENANVDAVLIATPFNTHSKIAIDALDAGKHVYCEKTLAKGYHGINDLAGKVRTSNKIFQTGHQYHSSRLYQHAVDLIRNGEIGKIISFECQFNRNSDWRRPVPDPDLERLINWRMYREFSGGLLAELSSHQIDIVNWVTKSNPEKVMGVGGIDYWKDGRETFDNIHLIYTYPQGIKATFTCLTSNAKDNYKTMVKGDKGTLILDYDQAWIFPEGKENKVMGNVDGVAGATVAWDQGMGIPIALPHKDPSKQALLDFRDCIVDNTEPYSNVDSGATTAICVQMGLDAMYHNKIVYWNDHLNLGQ